MSGRTDAFKRAIRVNISDQIVRIKSRNQSGLKFMVYLIMLLADVVLLIIQGYSVGSLYLLAVFGVIAFLLYQEIRIALYPLTILDVKNKLVLRKSFLGLVKPKSYQFEDLKGISMSVQAVGGYATADEDETTDYEKTLILETENGEVPLFNFVSRIEEAEESLTDFMNVIKERLSQPSVS